MLERVKKCRLTYLGMLSLSRVFRSSPWPSNGHAKTLSICAVCRPCRCSKRIVVAGPRHHASVYPRVGSKLPGIVRLRSASVIASAWPSSTSHPQTVRLQSEPYLILLKRRVPHQAWLGLTRSERTLSSSNLASRQAYHSDSWRMHFPSWPNWLC